MVVVDGNGEQMKMTTWVGLWRLDWMKLQAMCSTVVQYVDVNYQEAVVAMKQNFERLAEAALPNKPLLIEPGYCGSEQQDTLRSSYHFVNLHEHFDAAIERKT